MTDITQLTPLLEVGSVGSFIGYKGTALVPYKKQDLTAKQSAA